MSCCTGGNIPYSMVLSKAGRLCCWNMTHILSGTFARPGCHIEYLLCRRPPSSILCRWRSEHRLHEVGVLRRLQAVNREPPWLARNAPLVRTSHQIAAVHVGGS